MFGHPPTVRYLDWSFLHEFLHPPRWPKQIPAYPRQDSYHIYWDVLGRFFRSFHVRTDYPRADRDT